jgi:3-deoxy-D-arabino-heptulosonate 7-phosphate (DAHP) synthase
VGRRLEDKPNYLNVQVCVALHPTHDAKSVFFQDIRVMRLTKKTSDLNIIKQIGHSAGDTMTSSLMFRF